jgi:hypothetical protein
MPVAIVQKKETLISSATNTWTHTFDSAITAGNVVVLIAKLQTAIRTVGNPSGGGASFVSIQTIGGNATGSLKSWSSSEPNSSVTSYQITIGGGLTATGVVYGWELSGCDGSTPTASGTGTQNTATTAPQMVDSALTVPSNGVMLGAISSQVAATWGTLTDPTSFARDYQSVVLPGISVFFGSRTASGSTNGAATTTTARAVWGLAATWSEAAAGGQPYAKRLGGVPHNGFRRRGMY